MSTLTGTAVINQSARQVHAGTNSSYFEVSASTTLTVGSIVLMGKVPDRARIVDGWFVIPTAANVVNVGLYAYDQSGTLAAVDADKFAAAASASAGHVQRFWANMSAAGNAGYQVSISDSNLVRTQIVAITSSSLVGDTTGKYQLYVEYYMDGEETT